MVGRAVSPPFPPFRSPKRSVVVFPCPAKSSLPWKSNSPFFTPLHPILAPPPTNLTPPLQKPLSVRSFGVRKVACLLRPPPPENRNPKTTHPRLAAFRWAGTIKRPRHLGFWARASAEPPRRAWRRRWRQGHRRACPSGRPRCRPGNREIRHRRRGRKGPRTAIR